jgi:ferric-dicitrate binding protein FerR (iron transport regulator)
MNRKERNDELDVLLRKISDGDLQPSDATRLNELLRGDPGACEAYLDHVSVEAGLEREFGGLWNEQSASGSKYSSAAPPDAGNATLRFPRWLGYALAAAIALVATLVIQHLLPSTPSTDARVEISPTTVATLVFAESCEWADGNARVEGQRLAAGLVSLRRGTAVLRFDGGAALVLEGEAELELESAGSARLRRGAVVVRATDGAEGFRLLTPASEVVDLGTEFAVKVERGGATEVHVIEGEIAWRKESASQPDNVLAAGHAVRFDRADSSEPREVALSAAGFDETVLRARPRERPDLMTVYEGFHYDEASYAPEQIIKGKGWAGPWRLRQGIELRNVNETDTATDMRIVHGKLTVPWPVTGGRLGMLEMPAGRTFRVRPTANPIAMGQDGITYFSMMTLEPDHSTRSKSARPQEGVRLTFRSSAEFWGECLSFGWDRRLQPHIQAGAAGTFVSLAKVPSEQSLLWVGKIIRRADGEDEVFFRIYGQADVLDFTEPATWHVASRGLHQDAAFDLVVLSSAGQSPRIVDELRIGPTWRSVVPIQRQLAKLK